MSEPPRITAVLGPTNTGKTHLAMERLLGYRTGMIGFPLRLLARENYDKAVAIKGSGQVALITGEEKIVPPTANYYFCTVESMPLDRRTDFVAVDEVQLCADPDRGHIFTDRLLSARGEVETMFLGSETIRPLIQKLVPEAECINRPRLSKLSYAGVKKLTRLPRRSAVVAFSASEVYGIAELVRRQRGGAAVVLGALSPRTRNAQVALYQSGEVDYLVATDAIGMGLNMNVNHVAFAALSKFDGTRNRALEAQEVAQIAGRAGRHMNDGTFGVTADASAMEPDLIERVETHTFQPLKAVQWRNPNLKFTSIDALLNSLRVRPERIELARAKPAPDQLVLETMARDESVQAAATSPDAVRLLWSVARVPDFHAKLADSHARLLTQVFHFVNGDTGCLPEDWVEGHVKRIDRTDGDMHALMDRIAAVRVWTYIANQGAWLADAAHWQGITRAIEDRLSDALHEKLTQQFVDKRTSVLMQRLHANDVLDAQVDAAGSVEVEGHFIGHLTGLSFKADATGSKAGDRAVLNAAAAALRPKMRARVAAICEAEDAAFSLSDHAQILWSGVPIGRLTAGADILHPQVDVPSDEHLEPELRDKVIARLSAFLAAHVADVLAPLIKVTDDPLTGPAQGILFQVMEGLGSQPRHVMADLVNSLSDEDRAALSKRGIRFGVDSVYIPQLLKAGPQRLRALLWMAHTGRIAPQLPEGRVSFDLAPGVPSAFYIAAGVRVVKGRAYRIDMMERFAATLRANLRAGEKHLKPESLSLLGMTMDHAPDVLNALGYKAVPTDDGLEVKKRFRNRGKPKADQKPQQSGQKSQKSNAARKHKKKPAYNPDSPFAVLKDLVNP